MRVTQQLHSAARTVTGSALIAALLSLGTYNSAMAQQLEATAQVRQAAVGIPNVVELTNVPRATPQLRTQPGATAASLPRPQTGVAEPQWKALKAQAARLPDPNTSTPAGGILRPSSSSASAPDPGNASGDTPGAFIAFVAQDEDLFCSGGSTPTGILTPSDMALAVGQKDVVQVVNDCISVYDKTSNVLVMGPTSLNTFLGFPANNFDPRTGNCIQCVTDPRAMYDFVANRFVVIALFEDFSNSRGFLGLAASQTNDPTGAWNVYQLQVGATGQCPDFPTLGQNWANDPFVGGIYIGFNVFQCNPGGFLGFAEDQVFFLPKSSIYAGQGFGFNFAFGFNVGGILVDTIQPVNVSEWGQKPRTEFAVNSFNINFGDGQCRSGCNGLVVWSLANTLQQPGSPGPVISGIVTGTPSNYIFPASADQPGADNSIDTGDTRISGAIQYMGGLMYPTLNSGNGGTSAVLGWQVQAFLDDNGPGGGPVRCGGTFANACPTITSATIVKEFCYDCGAGHDAGAYYGTIQPDPEGNWTMAFNFSNRSISPGTAYTSNRVTWPTPFHDGGIFLCQNQAFYNPNIQAGGRWGDYTGTAIDLLNTDGTPSITPAFWFSGMFVKNNGNWSTCIGANTYTSVTEP
jgi:hypothetical protein